MTRKEIASRKAVLTKKIARMERQIANVDWGYAAQKAAFRRHSKFRTDPFWRNSRRISLELLRSDLRHLRNYRRERAALENQ